MNLGGRRGSPVTAHFQTNVSGTKVSGRILACAGVPYGSKGIPIATPHKRIFRHVYGDKPV